MNEKEYKLELHGILDLAAAERLRSEIERRLRAGAETILLDCSRTDWMLHDALRRLRDIALNQGADQAGKCRVEMVRVPGAVLSQARLLDYETLEDSIILAPEKSGQAREPAAIICRGCEQALRVPEKGDYACPHCRERFHVDKFGRATFYENLGVARV